MLISPWLASDTFTRRPVDYDAAGEPVGVEILDAARGVEVDGFPRALEIQRSLCTFGRFVA